MHKNHTDIEYFKFNTYEMDIFPKILKSRKGMRTIYVQVYGV